MNLEDHCWLESEWFYAIECIDRFRDFLALRGVGFGYRVGNYAGTLTTEGCFAINIQRRGSDMNRLATLLHEYTHFELGHRETEDLQQLARNEIECCLVNFLVCWMFYMVKKEEDYILRHAMGILDLREKAARIVITLVEGKVIPDARCLPMYNPRQCYNEL